MQTVSKKKALDLIQSTIEEGSKLPATYTGKQDYHPWETWLRTLLVRMSKIYSSKSKNLNEINQEVNKIKQANNLEKRSLLKGHLLAILRAYHTEIVELWDKDVNNQDEGVTQAPKKSAKTANNSNEQIRTIENHRPSIIVIAALYEELDKVFDDRSTIGFPLELNWTRHTLGSLKIKYWRTQLGENYDLIAVTPDSMGLTETSIVATAAFSAFNPVLTAMLGICAGRHDENVRLGHIIVPTQAFHYQFGARTEDGLEPEIRAESVDASFYTSAQRISGHQHFENWMNDQHPKSLCPKARCECHVGPMASSDYVAKWDELVEHAVNMDRKVIGIDMESYAFLRTAKLFGLSRESFVVKCVTDYADRDKDDQIREWAQVAAARFFYFMLMRWIDDNDETRFWAEKG